MSADLSLLEFIKPSKRAVMVTRRKDGRLQTSVVTAVFNPAGEVWVWTRDGSAKQHNLRRDPRATLCIVDDAWHEWMHVEGETEIILQPDAMPLLEDYYRFREQKEHADWSQWHQRMLDEKRQLFRIRPTGILKPPRE